MGYIAHDAVIVTVAGYVKDRQSEPQLPDVEAFRRSLPEEWRRLVVGPIRAVVNGDFTYFFAPDGSKEWWATSDEGDRYRQQFIDLFSWTYGDGSGPFDVVAVRFGGDFGSEVGVRVTYDSRNQDDVRDHNRDDFATPNV